MRGPPSGGPRRESEARERAVAGVGDLKERVELRELEQRLEIVVQIRETELTALFTNLLGERDEDAQPGAVDVAGLRDGDGLPRITTDVPDAGPAPPADAGCTP